VTCGAVGLGCPGRDAATDQPCREQVGPVGVVLDQGLQQVDHLLGLTARRRPQVDVLVVERPEGRQRVCHRRSHRDHAGGRGGVDDRPDERGQLHPTFGTALGGHCFGQHRGRDDPRVYGVLEVVTDVGDAVGPADDLALEGRRCRS
jgi:hypothetical protein